MARGYGQPQIDMFGPGGEGLGGFFVGQHMAQERDAAEAARQATLADIAMTQQKTRAMQMENEMNQQIMPDKISEYREGVVNKREDRQYEKFKRMGENMGQLGSVLSQVPAAARQAALTDMVGQMGATDHPLYKSLMDMDPNEIPATLKKWQDEAFAASEKARLEKMGNDSAMDRTKYEVEARERMSDKEIQAKREMNREDNATRMRAASISAAPRAAPSSGTSGLDKMSTDQAISYLERKKALSGGALSHEEEMALYNLKKFKVDSRAVGVPDTGPAIMNNQNPTTAMDRAAAAVGPPPVKPGQAPAPAPAAAAKPQVSVEEAVKKAGQKYEPNKYEYRITPDGRVQRREK